MSQQTILMMAEKSSINVTLYTLLWLQMLRYYKRNTEIDWESSRIQSSLLAQKKTTKLTNPSCSLVRAYIKNKIFEFGEYINSLPMKITIFKQSVE